MAAELGADLERATRAVRRELRLMDAAGTALVRAARLAAESLLCSRAATDDGECVRHSTVVACPRCLAGWALDDAVSAYLVRTSPVGSDAAPLRAEADVALADSLEATAP